MLFIILIFLLLSNSITSRRDKSILYSRTAIIILIVTSFIAYDNFFTKGIAVLWNNPATTYSFHNFHFLITLVIILTSVILLGLHMYNHMKNLPIKFIFFLDIFIIYLSSERGKNTNNWVKINRGLSIFFTLAFFIFIPYLANINIINYLQALLCLILLGIITHYIYPSYLFHNKELPGIDIVPGYIDGVISAIVNESIIPDYFTCILIFTGLLMLMYGFTLDNKSSLSMFSKIKQIWKNKCKLLLLGMGFFFLSIILSYFSILIINKDSLIVFSLTVFSRIVFYRLIFAVIYTSFTRAINKSLLSLNILTVLYIICIVYVNVFITTPFICTTFYCTTFYSWYVNKYNSGIVDAWIKMYNKDISHFIMQCSKVLSSNPIFRKLLTMLATIKPNLLSVRHTSFSELYPLSFKRSYNQWLNSKYIIKPIKLRKFLPAPVNVFKPITLEHSTIVNIKANIPSNAFSYTNEPSFPADTSDISINPSLSNLGQGNPSVLEALIDLKAEQALQAWFNENYTMSILPGENYYSITNISTGKSYRLIDARLGKSNLDALRDGEVNLTIIPDRDDYRQTEGSSGKWDNFMKILPGCYSCYISWGKWWKASLSVGQYINPNTPIGLGMKIITHIKPIHINFIHCKYLLDPIVAYSEGPSCSAMTLPDQCQTMRWMDTHPTIWNSIINSDKRLQDYHAHYKKYDDPWVNKACDSTPHVEESSLDIKTVYGKSKVNDSSSKDKSKVSDLDSAGEKITYKVASGVRSFCSNASECSVCINGDVGDHFTGTNLITSDKSQVGEGSNIDTQKGYGTSVVETILMPSKLWTTLKNNAVPGTLQNSDIWAYNTSKGKSKVNDSSFSSKSNVNDSSFSSKSNVNDSSSKGKSKVNDSSSKDKSKVSDLDSAGEKIIYNVTSGVRSYCNNTSQCRVNINGDVGSHFIGTNFIISDKNQVVLRNIGSGIAVGGGLIGGSIIAATSESSTIAKLGIMVAGGVIGGGSSLLFNEIDMISKKNLHKNRPEIAESLEDLNTLVKGVEADVKGLKANVRSINSERDQ